MKNIQATIYLLLTSSFIMASAQTPPTQFFGLFSQGDHSRLYRSGCFLIAFFDGRWRFYRRHLHSSFSPKKKVLNLLVNSSVCLLTFSCNSSLVGTVIEQTEV